MARSKTTFTWHPATESPGKRTVLMAFKVKGHEKAKFTFSDIRFLESGIIPAECHFKTQNGVKKLAVAWAYYDEVVKGITQSMFHDAEFDAWAWWPDDKPGKEESE